MFASVAIGVVTILFGQFLGVVLAPQEAFAPSGRRGFFCEFRPEAQLDIAYPAQMNVMQQVALNAGENPLMLIHN